MKRLLKILLSYFPTKLPVGLTQFEAWATDIMDITGRVADEESMRFVLASELLHSDAKKGSVPKNYFASRMRKLAANQVAGYVLQEIKAKQEALKKAAAAEEAKLQQAADTTAPAETERVVTIQDA
jgi:hypothetical protein